ncbi:histidine kinase [Streptomyces sp. NPDC058045]|uniref:sensor histidine kinase n=1 Tax=Streptomyces sp. NPDC058045 TaxID=3346311 RepID=UPI0036E5E61B
MTTRPGGPASAPHSALAPSELRRRLVPAGRAAGRGLVLAVLALGGSLLLLVPVLVSLALIPLGVGLFTTPPLLRAVRAHADRRRLLAASWYGLRVPAAPPLPEPAGGGPLARARHCLALLREPSVRRDLGWLPVDLTAGAVLALLPPALLAEGVFGLLLPMGLWRPVVAAADGYRFGFVPVSGEGTAVLAALLGLVWLVVGVLFGPALVGAHFRLVRAVLDPRSPEELARRVDRLTATRHDAVDTSAAELRRIERDLHDGAQARLVAMGIGLGAAEALLERDPEQARRLLAEARSSSAEALAELRDLVRGIHPPVLAERGLADAVRALALRLPVATDVRAELPEPIAEPVESAAYFAVSELLTNAVKHSGAERIRVEAWQDAGRLRITVSDDGCGGARAGAGGGLAGVERRLGTFDGVLAVRSPTGGPTLVTLEIPCA